jgi:hypothetical protein
MQLVRHPSDRRVSVSSSSSSLVGSGVGEGSASLLETARRGLWGLLGGGSLEGGGGGSGSGSSSVVATPTAGGGGEEGVGLGFGGGGGIAVPSPSMAADDDAAEEHMFLTGVCVCVCVCVCVFVCDCAQSVGFQGGHSPQGLGFKVGFLTLLRAHTNASALLRDARARTYDGRSRAPRVLQCYALSPRRNRP